MSIETVTPDTFNSLFLGYSAFWLILAAYIYSINKRLSKYEKESSISESAKLQFNKKN
jgi:CcmD family protein